MSGFNQCFGSGFRGLLDPDSDPDYGSEALDLTSILTGGREGRHEPGAGHQRDLSQVWPEDHQEEQPQETCEFCVWGCLSCSLLPPPPHILTNLCSWI